MGTISRAEYDEHRIWINMQAGMTEVEAFRQHEGSYPMSTEWVIFELQDRGLDATPWVIERYCKHILETPPPIIGGSRVWSKQAIDELAQALERADRLMPSARYRKELGITWKQERAMLEREKSRREAEHAGN